MIINGLRFFPDGDHDWIHYINEETREHYLYNANLYNDIDRTFGKLLHKKLVNGFWKAEKLSVQSKEESSLADYLQEFINRKQFKEFIKQFLKYVPCIEDEKLEELLKNFAKKSFDIGIDYEASPFFCKNIDFYLD